MYTNAARAATLVAISEGAQPDTEEWDQVRGCRSIPRVTEDDDADADTYDSDADAAAYGGDKLCAQGATVPPEPYSLD